MPSHVLPPLPATIADLEPLLVGGAARRALRASWIHQPPEVWVRTTPDALALACPDAAPDPGAPDHLKVGPWRVKAVEDYEAGLRARGVPMDAIGVRPDGAIIDPLGGAEDLRLGRLQLPDDLDISAHPLVTLAVPALASELALHVPNEVLERVREEATAVFRADRHEARRMLTALLVGREPAKALGLLRQTKTLALLLPEVAALVNFHQSSRHHHKDVWDHTRQVVRQAMPRADLRWAALLHDVGKVHTRGYGPGKKVSFLRHDEVGAYLVEGIAARLCFPAELAEKVRLLVFYHLRAALYSKGWSDAAIRRFDLELRPLLPDLLALSRADVTSKRRGRRREAIWHLDALRSRIEGVRAADVAKRPLIPKGLGHAIMARLGVAPGRRVGELRQMCEAAARAGSLGVNPSLETCVRFLAEHVREE